MIPVLVTTDKDKRGVFFGYLDSEEQVGNTTLTLRDARNCIYWSTEMHGVFGLAGKGPDKNCRIGPKIQSLTLQGVTSVARVSPQAVVRWEEEPWKS